MHDTLLNFTLRASVIYSQTWMSKHISSEIFVRQQHVHNNICFGSFYFQFLFPTIFFPFRIAAVKENALHRISITKNNLSFSIPGQNIPKRQIFPKRNMGFTTGKFWESIDWNLYH